MDPDRAAADDGQAQLPEHATVAVASEPPSSYLPASQLLQVEAPASEYLPATTSPSLSAHPHLLPMQARVTPWLPAGVRSGARARGGGLERGACLWGTMSRSTMNLLPFSTSTCLPSHLILTVSSPTAPQTLARVTTWHPAGVRSGARLGTEGLACGAQGAKFLHEQPCVVRVPIPNKTSISD